MACIPGIGAMPNCHFRLSNVRESFTHYDTAGLHRSKHPGAGAFSGFHGREAIALKDISAGSEIFVDYGEVRTSSNSYIDYFIDSILTAWRLYKIAALVCFTREYNWIGSSRRELCSSRASAREVPCFGFRW